MSKSILVVLLSLSACASPCHDLCESACGKLTSCTNTTLSSSEFDECVDECVAEIGGDDEYCSSEDVSPMSCSEFMDWFAGL